MYRHALAVLFVALSPTAVGCGKEAEKVAGTPTPRPTFSIPLATVVPVPQGTATITDSLFEYPAKGYTARIPAGWTAAANFYGARNTSADAFFGPKGEEEIQPNISVSCEPPPPGVTAQAFAEGKLTVLRGTLGPGVPVALLPVRVAGLEGFLIAFSREPGQVQGEARPGYDRTDVMFIGQKCGFVVSLTTPSGERSTYEPAFNDFLSSFRLLP